MQFSGMKAGSVLIFMFVSHSRIFSIKWFFFDIHPRKLFVLTDYRHFDAFSDPHIKFVGREVDFGFQHEKK